MLPTLVDEPPSSDQWLHEIKHDGYRTQLHLAAGRSRAFTRNGNDWSDSYRLVLDCAEGLRRSAVLDGEMIVQESMVAQISTRSRAPLLTLPNGSCSTPSIY